MKRNQMKFCLRNLWAVYFFKKNVLEKVALTRCSARAVHLLYS
jgi:hypothetical protein